MKTFGFATQRNPADVSSRDISQGKHDRDPCLCSLRVVVNWTLPILFFLSSLSLEAIVSANDHLLPDQYMERGSELFRQGKFDQAATTWTEAVGLYKRENNLPKQGAALVQLAEALKHIGLYKKASLTLERALELADKLKNKILAARVWEGLGNIRLEIGQNKKAIEALNKGLAFARDEEDSLMVADLLNSLGNALSSSNRYTEALGAYTESAVLAESAERPDLEATALINSAKAAVQERRSVDAEERLDLAAEKVNGLPNSYIKVMGLLNLGLSYTKLIARIPTEEEPSSSPERKGAERGIGVEPDTSPQELAQVFPIPEAPLSHQSGRQDTPPESTTDESLWLRAHHAFNLGASVAGYIGDDRSESYALGYLGNLYEEKGQYEKALTLTRRAVVSAQKAIAPESLYRWHWQTARIQRANGKLDAAQKAYNRAIIALQSIRSEVSVAYRARSQSFRREVGPLFFELADLLMDRSKTTQDTVQAKQYLVEARNTIETFKAAELQDYFQDDCVQVAQSLSATLEQASPQTAIIYPILLSNRLETLVNFPSGLKPYTVMVGEKEITERARQFRQTLQDPRTDRYLSHAQTLYDWLIRPLEPDLRKERITTLVFVPDGALRSIPLAALHDGKEHLIQHFALATTPGMTLTDPRPLDRTNIKLLAFGLTEGVQGFPPLHYVSSELESIRGLYDSRVFINGEFKVTSVEEELRKGDFGILHIASHGLVESQVEDTFVLAYDEKITMDRLAELVGLFKFRKSPLELLTLSACETAAGDDRAAFGLAGVAVKAGARSALATLWFINDKVASDLVGVFYKQLKDPSRSKAQALQHAQVEILETADYQHPSYWAPFLLINNWL